MKRYHIENELTYPISKNVKQQLISRDWSLQNSKKFKRNNEKEEEQQYHCQVYLKLFPSTLKCSLDVIVKSINKLIDDNDDNDSILIAKTRIPKIIKPGLMSKFNSSFFFSI
jgi:hypothetical protein